jgi:nucleoside-diphosphate-sugar epimerase
MRVAVTGGSGHAGRWVVRELLEHDHDIVSVDLTPSGDAQGRFLCSDLRDYWQTLAALKDIDAVVHLAAIPTPTGYAPEVVFSTNVTALWNVLQAAEANGIPKLVLASSINAIGASFCHTLVPPLCFPIDESHPTRAEDAYGLSKWVGEQMADGFARRRPIQIASLRLHGFWDDERLKSLREHPITDPAVRAKNFWGYIHLADCARACRLALEVNWQGHEIFFINASDTVLSIPTRAALMRIYPTVALKRRFEGYESVISIEKAKRLLGWEPLHGWRM